MSDPSLEDSRSSVHLKSTLARHDILLLLLVLIAAAFLRVPQLDRESLWGDEIVHARAAKMATPLEVIRNVQPPHSVGYPLLLYFWMKISSADLLLRALSALAGIASLGLVFMFVRAFAGPRVGLFAVLLLALSASHLRFSREVAPYIPQTATLLAAGVVWLRALSTNSWRSWIGFALLAAGSHYLHPLASTTFVVWYTLTLVYCRVGIQTRDGGFQAPPKSFTLPRCLSSFVGFLLLISPQVMENLERASWYVGSAAAPLTFRMYRGEILRLFGGNWLEWTPWLWLLLTLLGLIVLPRISLFLTLAVLGWCAGTVSVWVAFKTAQSHFFDYHYFISHLPAFAILAAFGLEQLVKWAPSKIERPVAAVLAVGISLGLAPSAWLEFGRDWPDYRSAGRFLRDHLRPADRYTIRREDNLDFMVNYYCPGVADREVDARFLLNPEAWNNMEREGGTLYAVTRFPPETTSELKVSSFNRVFVVWQDPQLYTEETFKDLFGEGKSTRPGNENAMNLLEEARVYAKAKAWDQACDRIIHAASMAPHLHAILRVKAEILLDAGRFEEAAEAFEAARSRVPPRERWWMSASKAKALSQLKRPREALQELIRALDDPQPNVLYLNLQIGEAHLVLGELVEADHSFQAALKIDPRTPHALVRRGDVALAQGFPAIALGHYREAARIDGPDQEWAKTRLKEVERARNR